MVTGENGGGNVGDGNDPSDPQQLAAPLSALQTTILNSSLPFDSLLK